MDKIKNFLLIILLMIFNNNVFSMPDVSRALSDVEFQSDALTKTKLDIYKGKIIVLFFGYTNCPDIWPTALLDISKSLKELGQD